MLEKATFPPKACAKEYGARNELLALLTMVGIGDPSAFGKPTAGLGLGTHRRSLLPHPISNHTDAGTVLPDGIVGHPESGRRFCRGGRFSVFVCCSVGASPLPSPTCGELVKPCVAPNHTAWVPRRGAFGKLLPTSKHRFVRERYRSFWSGASSFLKASNS